MCIRDSDSTPPAREQPSSQFTRVIQRSLHRPTGRRPPAAPSTQLAGGMAGGSVELSVTPYGHAYTVGTLDVLQACDTCADMGITYSVIMQCADYVVYKLGFDSATIFRSLHVAYLYTQLASHSRVYSTWPGELTLTLTLTVLTLTL